MNVKIGGHTVEITHPDKIIFPRDGIIKQDFMSYYYSIAPVMIPHTKNRMVTMHRFVDGIDGVGFYQKDAGDYFPSWIKRFNVMAQAGHEVAYVLIQDRATLVYLANQLCITPHVCLSKVPRIDQPDRMVFDLDPSPGASFNDVVCIARILHDLLQNIGITPYVMTTGSRGVHVVVPLKRGWTFERSKACATIVAQRAVAMHPDKATMEIHKNKRGARIFVDVTRNALAQTTVAPYALRARNGAPVAAPITWDELGTRITRSDYFTMYDIIDRVNAVGDLWAGMEQHAVGVSTFKGFF